MRHNYPLYHDTFTSAVTAAWRWAESRGWEVPEHGRWDELHSGRHTRARPLIGTSNKFHFPLRKGGKTSRKRLHVQVYAMETGRFELNAYIE